MSQCRNKGLRFADSPSYTTDGHWLGWVAFAIDHQSLINDYARALYARFECRNRTSIQRSIPPQPTGREFLGFALSIGAFFVPAQQPLQSRVRTLPNVLGHAIIDKRK